MLQRSSRAAAKGSPGPSPGTSGLLAAQILVLLSPSSKWCEVGPYRLHMPPVVPAPRARPYPVLRDATLVTCQACFCTWSSALPPEKLLLADSWRLLRGLFGRGWVGRFPVHLATFLQDSHELLKRWH